MAFVKEGTLWLVEMYWKEIFIASGILKGSLNYIYSNLLDMRTHHLGENNLCNIMSYLNFN